jgi:hypothetical protein
MELPVSEFAAILESTPMSGMPQLANPAALASEVFNHLRGFVERAHYYGNLKPTPVGLVDDGNLTSASAEGGRVARLRGGPAPDNSALAGVVAAREGGASASQPVVGNTLADPQNTLSDQQQKILANFQRFSDLVLATVNFSVEANLVGGGLAEGIRSVNTLLKAQ